MICWHCVCLRTWSYVHAHVHAMCIYMYSPLLKFYVNAPKALVLLSCHCKEFAKFLASFIHLPVLVCTGKPINTNHVVFVCMPVFLCVVCVCHCVCAAPHDHNLGNNNRFESAFTGITVCSTHFVHECTAYPAVQHAKYIHVLRASILGSLRI